MVIAAALAVVFTLRPDTPATDPVARPITPMGAAGLSVRPGGGATAVAANGFTPIAFPATCEGAVAAIASAEQMLPLLGRVSGVTEEQWQLTIEQVFGKGSATANYYLGVARGAATDASVERVAKDRLAQLDMTTHPEWGGFRVVACRPGHSATVELLSCYRLGADHRTACYGEARQVRWAGQPADWVIQDHQATQDVVAPAIRQKIDNDADALSGVAPSAAKRAEWLTALGSGWQEFSNAPR